MYNQVKLFKIMIKNNKNSENLFNIYIKFKEQLAKTFI